MLFDIIFTFLKHSGGVQRAQFARTVTSLIMVLFELQDRRA